MAAQQTVSNVAALGIAENKFSILKGLFVVHRAATSMLNGIKSMISILIQWRLKNVEHVECPISICITMVWFYNNTKSKSKSSRLIDVL